MSGSDDGFAMGCSLILFLALIIFSTGAWIFNSSMEASAYNKVTGNNVSTWDAMWIELRVQDAPMQRNRD